MPADTERERNAPPGIRNVGEMYFAEPWPPRNNLPSAGTQNLHCFDIYFVLGRIPEGRL